MECSWQWIEMHNHLKEFKDKSVVGKTVTFRYEFALNLTLSSNILLTVNSRC